MMKEARSQNARMSNLCRQFLDRANFQLAWEQVQENRGCAGVDGESIAHFARHADQYLNDLRDAVAEEKYRPLPLRQILIPKRQGGWRRLGVPTVRDRLIQQALLNVLHPILEPQFEPCSYAYRPGDRIGWRLRRLATGANRGYEWVLDADIVSYFDNIDRDRLLTEVAERVNHPLLLALIAGWISAGVLSEAGLVFFAKGIPQGAVISPILANVYLDDLDKALTALGLKVVRYADDFVVLARTEARILQAQQEVAALLKEMKLELHG
jgi:group II intron reverse transcriptase/maturase